MRTKKRRLISFVSLSFALIIMTTLMLGSVVMAAPTSDMLVIDNADMLTKEEEQTIESALYQIYKQTDIEYVVYLAPSLDGKTVEEASLEAGRKLGVGDKEDNTGLLIYVALADSVINTLDTLTEFGVTKEEAEELGINTQEVLEDYDYDFE